MIWALDAECLFLPSKTKWNERLFFLFVCLCECANVSIFDSQSSGKWIAANRVRCFLNKSDLCARNHYTTTATLCYRQTICLAKFKSSVARTFEWQLRVFHTLFPSLSQFLFHSLHCFSLAKSIQTWHNLATATNGFFRRLCHFSLCDSQVLAFY